MRFSHKNAVGAANLCMIGRCIASLTRPILSNNYDSTTTKLYKRQYTSNRQNCKSIINMEDGLKCMRMQSSHAEDDEGDEEEGFA